MANIHVMTMNELDYIRFDVGNHLFVCHRSTINRFPESRLADLIKPENDTRKSSQDYIIIERDGKHFGTILNYMRDPTSLELTAWNLEQLEQLEREADFVNISAIVESCKVEKYYKLQPTTDGALRLAKYDIVFDGEILNHLSGHKRLTYLFSFQLCESFNQLLADIDPSKIDVCCFLGSFPGCENAKSLIYNPMDKEVLCASSSPDHQYEMICIAQRIAKLGVGYYDQTPALFEMVTKSDLRQKPPMLLPPFPPYKACGLSRVTQ